jgi:hypothetical protein
MMRIMRWNEDERFRRSGNRVIGQEARRLCERREFVEALRLYSSEERALRLFRWRRDYQMTTAELREVLVEWWTVIEAWSDAFWSPVKLNWLREVGYISDADRAFGGEVTIYRGNQGELEPAGLSWTLSRSRARFFAQHGQSARGKFLGIYRPEGRPSGARVWPGGMCSRFSMAVASRRSLSIQPRCTTSSNAYRKLGVHSRIELARVVTDQH